MTRDPKTDVLHPFGSREYNRLDTDPLYVPETPTIEPKPSRNPLVRWIRSLLR